MKCSVQHFDQYEIKYQMTRLYEVVTGLKPYLPPNKFAANAKDGI